MNEGALSPALRKSESGRGYASVIISLLVLVALTYAGIQVVPVYVNNFQLNDYLTDVAQRVAVKQVGADDAQTAVVTKAAALHLPVEPEDVQVSNGGNSTVVHVRYTVPIDLKVYTWALHFTDTGSAPNSVY